MEKKSIRDAYKRYWLENGQAPVSVFALCKILDVPEADFYQHYSHFDSLEADIWLEYFQQTVDQLKDDETYRQYTSREKLLAFYFLWVQKLKEDRSYILQQYRRSHLPLSQLGQLSAFKRAFYDYASGLIKEGYLTSEIRERKYISDQYVHGFWVQALFVLKYWIGDRSEQFELTDAAIEKAVNLSFELIHSNTIDSLIDFGKFMFTRK